MRVIPRTHHLVLEQPEERKDVENVLGSAMRDEHVNEAKAVDVILKAGDLSLHHPNIIHGSKANTSELWRMGLTIRYIPTSTRLLKPEMAAPFLLRGKAVPGVNAYHPKPKYQDSVHMPFAGCEQWR